MTAATQTLASPQSEARTRPAVQLAQVRKTFGSNVAVEEVELDIRQGEFLTLLGPSGCGKTTLLSMLAGFLTPDSGSVLIDGADMTPLPAHRRPVNTVFQDYALFPHMNVVDNVAFGLRMDKVGKREARERAMETLAKVDLADFSQSRIGTLSGGQRQRVALARALVKEPKVLLLDEPFAALDLRLRQRLQLDLRQLHRRTDTTFVFVTHDQEEASVLSDRIAVMREGHLEQLGTPEEIYDAPRTRFVAEFIGESNVFDAHTTEPGLVEVPGLAITIRVPTQPTPIPQGRVAYAVRPERIRLSEDETPNGHVAVEARVEEVMRVGELVRVLLQVGQSQISMAIPAWARPPKSGHTVRVTWDLDDATVMED